ncbi:MAG: hypothetical protein ACR2KE_10090 [Candidatus Nanopelagicales bacterium]
MTTEVILHGLSASAAPFGVAELFGDSAKAADGIASLMSAAYAELRRLRVEMVLAAMSDPVVAAPMLVSDSATVQALARAGAPSARNLPALAEAIRTLMLGLVVLQQTIGSLDAPGFRCLSRGCFSRLAQSRFPS